VNDIIRPLLGRDGMAERTNVSVASRAVAGSNLGHGRHFSPGRHLYGERPPSPGRAWQNLRVPNLKFCQTKHTYLQKTTVPSPTVKNHPMT